MRYYKNMNQDSGYDEQTLATSVEAAAMAELVIPAGSGAPAIEPVVPLLLDGVPALALTYDRREKARAIERARSLTLALAEPRMARIGWSPLVVGVRASVEPDPEGEVFVERLLEQELRKYPPSVPLANSFLLQRENWWYLSRLILRLHPQREPEPIPRREDSSHGLLAWNPPDAENPAARTVAVGDTSSGRPRLGLTPDQAPEDGTPAALRLHDFEIPEMERKTELILSGRVRGGTLEVESRSGSAELGKRPGAIARWRAERSLERGCKRGLKEGYPPR